MTPEAFQAAIEGAYQQGVRDGMAAMMPNLALVRRQAFVEEMNLFFHTIHSFAWTAADVARFLPVEVEAVEAAMGFTLDYEFRRTVAPSDAVRWFYARRAALRGRGFSQWRFR